MGEENNLTRDILGAIGDERGRIGRYTSAHEAYALLKHKAEDAEKVASNIKKTLDELWKVVKLGDADAITAYAQQLETDARNAAVSFAGLSAAAGNVD